LNLIDKLCEYAEKNKWPLRDMNILEIIIKVIKKETGAVWVDTNSDPMTKFEFGSCQNLVNTRKETEKIIDDAYYFTPESIPKSHKAYKKDPKYRALVDEMYSSLLNGTFTYVELEEAVKLAIEFDYANRVKRNEKMDI